MSELRPEAPSLGSVLGLSTQAGGLQHFALFGQKNGWYESIKKCYVITFLSTSIAPNLGFNTVGEKRAG